ncbi:unnamed protein product [marine sediment metagenome]|uniref:Uncharacterized protein n=1 Tax=marine sediment metagenome TaxID=412755 RepID=X0WEX1_9ZZZZ
MKRTNCTGQNCVGEVRLSALDAGFDLRVVDHTIVLPTEFASVGLDIDGTTWLLEGTRAEMVAAIKQAGYTISEQIGEDMLDD